MTETTNAHSKPKSTMATAHQSVAIATAPVATAGPWPLLTHSTDCSAGIIDTANG